MTSKILIAALAVTAFGATAVDARSSHHMARNASGGDMQAKAATRELNQQQLASAANTGSAPGTVAPSMATAPSNSMSGTSDNSGSTMGPSTTGAGTMTPDAAAPDATGNMPAAGDGGTPADSTMPPR